MSRTFKTIANMFAAASQARFAGHMFMETDKGVTCYAPLGRKQDAEDFVKEVKSITVKEVSQVDYPISNVNRPPTTNKAVIALQAALDSAGLSTQVLVFANDGIKVITEGPKLEVYQALFLLRNAEVTFYEGTFFQHC